MIPTYNAAILASAPIGYWKISEIAGTVMSDSSGNAHHGTYVGAVQLGQTGLLEDDYYSAERCANFAGTSRATVPYGTWMNTTSMSVEAWCRASTILGPQVIVERDTNGSAGTVGRVWNLLISSAGFPSYSTWTGLSSTKSCFYPTEIVPLTVYYLVGTFNGSMASLYVNGRLAAQVEYAGALIRPTSSGITIGNGPGGTLPFNGAVEKVAFYNRALTAAEIDKHWIASNPGGINPTLNATPTMTTAPADAAAVIAVAAPFASTAVGGSLASQGTFFIAPR